VRTTSEPPWRPCRRSIPDWDLQTLTQYQTHAKHLQKLYTELADARGK
jgi:hypothetical protein